MLDDITEQLSSRKRPPLQGKWLDRADSYLKNQKIEKDSWWRSMNTTLGLLKQAQQLISQSEDKINQQAKRIAELQHLSSTDELTGLANRRGFMQAFARELDRANRDKSQGGLLIMIDLDNFKSINDTYSHDAGDTALKVVANALSNDIRAMDVAGRLGGDEFTILFVNTTRKDALERAQLLIKTLNNLSFIWNGQEVDIRASLGLKEYGKGSTAQSIFNAADTSMYQNKQQLRNTSIKQDNKRMS